MTGNCVTTSAKIKSRLNISALIIRIRASRMEAASAGWVEGARHLAGQLDSLYSLRTIDRRNRRQQRARIGMSRIRVKIVARGDLNDPAKVHDRGALADVLDHAQVVRDKKVGQTKPLLKVLQEVYDLRLNRNVERRNRFVENEERGLDRKRARDSDPLALAAREFMGMAVEGVRVETNHLEQMNDSLFFFAAARETMYFNTLADDRPHAHPRIQRGVGVLKDELHPAAQGAQLASTERGEIAALEHYAAGGRLEQAKNEAAESRFARAGLADEAQGLAAFNLQIDAVDGSDDEPVATE